MTTTSKTRMHAGLSALTAVLLAGTATTACGSGQGEARRAAADDPGIVLAFSGGGYHALSGGAAWLMGMMERTGKHDLTEITTNVRAIGSNSGGSWFMALAAYSPTFQGELEAPGAYRSFAGSPSGYMGKVWSYIRQATGGCSKMPTTERKLLCDGFYGVVKLKAGAGFANFMVSGVTEASGNGQWQEVVENSVFGKASGWGYYGDLAALTLGSERKGWAADKDIVFAGTFLTEAPALTYTSEDSVGLFNDVQALEGTQAWHGSAAVPGGVPLLLAAKGGTAVDPLPGGGLGLAYGTWNKQGSGWGFVPGTDKADGTSLERAEVSAALPSLPVANAAAISSAAGGGFIDVPVMAHQTFKVGKVTIKVSGKDVATALNGLAPAYQMRDAGSGASVMSFKEDVHQAFVTDEKDVAAATSALAENKVVRLADGGFVDNTAVAQMLRYLQDANGGSIPEGFTIVAFDDLPAPRSQWGAGDGDGLFPTGGDVAALFGFDQCNDDPHGCTMQADGLHHGGMMGFQYTGPSAQVFPCSGYFSGGCDGGNPNTDGILFWSPAEDQKIMCTIKGQKVEQPLLYSRYQVNVDASAPGSRLYGIDPKNDKVAGTLHVFAILGGGAAVVPGDEEEFACFDAMVTGMVENVKATGGKQCNTAEPSGDGNPCTLGDYLESALGL